MQEKTVKKEPVNKKYLWKEKIINQNSALSIIILDVNELTNPI